MTFHIQRYEVMEFHGKGDPFFGGSADDRILGKNGQFLTGRYARDAIAQFPSRSLAEVAAAKASRRDGSIIGIIPVRVP